MKLAIVFAALASGAMTLLIAYAMVEGRFGPEGSVLLGLAWGKVTMADLYVGFALFSSWVIYRERTKAVSIVCVLLVLTLGNAFTSLYVLVALLRSKGSWARFWLGHRFENERG